jgi:hypothetical protein
MVSLFKHSKNNQIEGVGGVIGKAKPIGIVAVKKVGEQLTGSVDQFTGFHAQIISGTSRVDPETPVERIHKSIYFIRLWKGSGATVKINQIFHKKTSLGGVPINRRRSMDTALVIGSLSGDLNSL